MKTFKFNVQREECVYHYNMEVEAESLEEAKKKAQLKADNLEDHHFDEVDSIVNSIRLTEDKEAEYDWYTEAYD